MNNITISSSILASFRFHPALELQIFSVKRDFSSIFLKICLDYIISVYLYISASFTKNMSFIVQNSRNIWSNEVLVSMRSTFLSLKKKQYKHIKDVAVFEINKISWGIIFFRETTNLTTWQSQLKLLFE